MIRILCFTSILFLITAVQDAAFACTGFAVFSKQVLFGMNFDYADIPMKLLITGSSDMKTFHLAFEKKLGDVTFFAKTAGMNTKGLFASCQEEHPYPETTPIPTEKDMFTFQLYEKIESTNTVREIESIANAVRLVNLPDPCLHNLFADISGNAIVTEAGPNGNSIIKQKNNYLVMTNFPNYTLHGKPYTSAEGKGADRYIICHEYIRNHIDNFTIDNALDLLDRAYNRDPEYPTSCSMVFDPQNSTVYIALNRNFSDIYKVSIETGAIELRKNPVRYSGTIPIGDKGLMISEMLAETITD